MPPEFARSYQYCVILGFGDSNGMLAFVAIDVYATGYCNEFVLGFPQPITIPESFLPNFVHRHFCQFPAAKHIRLSLLLEVQYLLS